MIDLSNITIVSTTQPTTLNEIALIENSIGAPLPAIYKDLLLTVNGFLTNLGIFIYGSNDLLERNENWEVSKYAVGYLAIGDDSGGKVFLMNQVEDSTELLIVDGGVMNPKEAHLLSEDLSQWITQGCKCEQITSNTPTFVTVILNDALEKGVEQLLSIKKAFGLEISSSVLLRGSTSIPFTLVEKMSYVHADTALRKLGSLSDKIVLLPIQESK